MFHKTFRNAELGSGSPTQSLVCCRSDAAQSVWTFIAHSFLLTRLICIFANRNVPRITSEWEPIYFMALLYFPWDSYVCTRDKMRQLTYLCWHHLGRGIWKSVKEYHIIITFDGFWKYLSNLQQWLGCAQEPGMLATDNVVITRLLSYTRPIYAHSHWRLLRKILASDWTSS